MRTVAADQLHVTMRFLGDVSPAQIDELRICMDLAVEGESPFTAELAGLGAFPDSRRPSVVWAGLMDGGKLNHVSSKLETVLEQAGFAPPDKPFHAHLTLARIRRPRGRRDPSPRGLDSIRNITTRKRKSSPPYSAVAPGPPVAAELERIRELLDQHQSTRFGTQEVSSILLFRSQLQPSGAVYSVLHQAKADHSGFS